MYAECLHDGTPQYEATWHLDEKAPRDVLVLDLPPLPPGYFTLGILLLRDTARSAKRAAGTENEERDLLAMRKVTIEVQDLDVLPISDEVTLIDPKVTLKYAHFDPY